MCPKHLRQRALDSGNLLKHEIPLACFFSVVSGVPGIGWFCAFSHSRWIARVVTAVPEVTERRIVADVPFNPRRPRVPRVPPHPHNLCEYGRRCGALVAYIVNENFSSVTTVTAVSSLSALASLTAISSEGVRLAIVPPSTHATLSSVTAYSSRSALAALPSAHVYNQTSF